VITRRTSLLLQTLKGEPAGRIAPYNELVNTFEFEEMARRSLAPAVFSEIAGSDARAFDKITFRYRMRDVRALDLSVDLFGEKLFAPILVGPASLQARYHAGGELATVRGASAGKAAVVVASKTSVALDKLTAEAKTPLFVQVENAEQAKAAAALGCKALFYTMNDWAEFEAVRKAVRIPVVVKGIMQAEEAANAVNRGAAGIVVSNYRALPAGSVATTIDALPSVTSVVAGRVPVFADGSFRRGTDILKALALGARAVLITRPVLWGLAAYGDKGVQQVVEMLQSELARSMVMCGTVNLAAITRAAIRIHSR